MEKLRNRNADGFWCDAPMDGLNLQAANLQRITEMMLNEMASKEDCENAIIADDAFVNSSDQASTTGLDADTFGFNDAFLNTSQTSPSSPRIC
ncbi:hypothetical protein MKW92_004741 [Papaver armeniacum]|nr:hypothetical protein MKW92_004741 [Papaver armeniacum]